VRRNEREGEMAEGVRGSARARRRADVGGSVGGVEWK